MIDEHASEPALNGAQLGALRAARSVELHMRQLEAERARLASTFNFDVFGRYLKRSRGLAELTQRQLAAQVIQRMLSVAGDT